MIWAKPLESVEIIFIIVFFIFYAAYLFKVIRVARRMNSPFHTVFFKLFLRTSFFILLITSLLGPSFGESTKEVKAIGKDIYFAVDLSGSMNAFDIQPTRLEKIKFELKNIVDAFSSDRVGLIIFSSEAFVQCPLTYDKSAFNLFLETLHTNLVPNAGTDFNSPLKIALKKFTDEESPSTQQKSKIVILISDGEDFGDSSKSIAESISNKGIKLFALGVGTERGSKIRDKNGFKKDRNQNDVITKLNARSLKELTATTGGKYFEINSNNNDVSKLINTIDSIEGELKDTKKIDASANKYYYFIALALALFAIDVLSKFKTLRI